MTKSKRTPTPATDRDGAAIIRVPLANCTSSAKVLAEDFEALRATGLTDNWYLNTNGRGRYYVRCHAPRAGNIVGLARIIADAGAGWIVTYGDDEPTNLRRDNLILRRGTAARPDAAFVGVT